MSSVAIIGAGIAGLSAGCYLRMNGYETTIFESHNLPGGLCTSWNRKGFTVDGCVHWLVGSRPGNSLHQMWQELGVLENMTFVDHDVYLDVHFADAPPVVLYTDLDRLREHLMARAPEDRAVIDDFVSGARAMARLDLSPIEPDETTPWYRKFMTLMRNARSLPAVLRYDRVSVDDFAARFKNPHLREAFGQFFLPGMPLVFMLATFGWLHDHNAGYPVGGSAGLARRIEKRYLDLGGQIRYRSRVSQILVEQGRAVGVRLEDGSDIRADDVVSAGDLHAVTHELTDIQELRVAVESRTASLEPFPGLVLIGLGIEGLVPEAVRSVSGTSLPLATPIVAGPLHLTRFTFHAFDHDPGLAPPGHLAAVAMLGGDYAWWEELSADRMAYLDEKNRLAESVVAALDTFSPGLSSRIRMVDVATPHTFRRYTGNFRGSFEGWLPTPRNYRTQLPCRFPEVQRLFFAGHWLIPGGGLPPAAYSGRHVACLMCQRDGRRWVATVPQGT